MYLLKRYGRPMEKCAFGENMYLTKYISVASDYIESNTRLLMLDNIVVL
jgi:hypothetical protein